MLPKKYFVVSGTGVSSVSPLNAFDKALSAAGIDQCNLVQVSSILPTEAREVKPQKIDAGAITFCVLARADGSGGHQVSAGVGWARCKNPKTGEEFGIVAEDEGMKDEKEVKDALRGKLGEMADGRSMKPGKIRVEAASLDMIPENMFGSAVAALVYIL